MLIQILLQVMTEPNYFNARDLHPAEMCYFTSAHFYEA